RLLLDVAHNPHAAANLAGRLRQLWPEASYRVVIAMLRDKDAAQVVEELLSLGRLAWYVGSLGGERGAPAEILYNQLRAHGEEQVQAFASVAEAFQAAEAEARPGDIVVVMGSFFTVTAALEWLEGESKEA